MPAEPASEGLEEEENPTIRIGCILLPLFMCFVPGLSKMPCPEKNLKGSVLRLFTVHSGNGPGLVCFRISGDAVWPNTMPLQGLSGIGKRHVLAGGNGVPDLCLDATYAGKEAGVKANGFIPRIRPRGEEKRLIENDPSFKIRRWVVELNHSWFNRFRKLLPCYEKTDLSYLALNSLAAAMIVLNKVKSIYI